MLLQDDRPTVGRHAPGPRGRRLVGSLREVRRDRLSFITSATREYGDVVGFRMGPKRLYLVSHPDHARHILCDNHKNYRKGIGLGDARPLFGEGLLTSDGDLWAAQRRLLHAAYQGGKLDGYAAAMVEAARGLEGRWRAHADSGRALDVSREMGRLTLGVLGATLFRDDFSDISDELREHFNTLTRWAMARMAAVVKTPLALPTPRNLRARRALRRLDEIVRRLVERRPRGGAGDDYLSLLGARGDGSQAVGKQLRDEVLTVLLAGHETTAATLTWALHLLSLNPDAQARLRRELDEVLGERPPTAADLPRLTYTRMLVEEAMRLYPPVWMIPRKAVSDDRLGGHLIPAGSDVLLSVYTLHRHPSFWDEPERFDPERFTPERSASRPACAYVPFGAGPRTCIGSRFGLMEVMLVLAVVARGYSFRPAAGAAVEADPSLTLTPRGGLPLLISGRESVAPQMSKYGEGLRPPPCLQSAVHPTVKGEGRGGCPASPHPRPEA